MPRLVSLAIVGAAVVALVLTWGTQADRDSPLSPDSSPAAPIKEQAAVAPTSLAGTRQVVIAAQPALPFQTNNLYADFQAAIGSSDRRAIEAGLVAWRKCAGYVWLGTSDIEAWVTSVVPEGLSRAEWNRRAQYARASALRCSGFAQQGDSLLVAEELSRSATAMGSPSEILRQALINYSAAPSNAIELSVASCNEVKHFSEGPLEGVRRITAAMRNAARKRPSHFLNGASRPAQDVGVNLALCDLDPDGCGAHSNFVGSACVQAGKCDFVGEVDYWKAETPAAVWDSAQEIREQLVKAVRTADCPTLFQ